MFTINTIKRNKIFIRDSTKFALGMGTCALGSFWLFYTKDTLSIWTNLGKHFVVHLGYVSLV